MERLSSHIFVLDPKNKPDGAKYIGYLGDKLMIDPSDAQIEVLAACAGMRLDSFCMRPRTSATLVENMMNFDANESTARLNELKKQLIFHKVYCALRLQKLEKTKK